MPYVADDNLPVNLDMQYHDDYIEITRRWLSWGTTIKAVVFIGAGYLLLNNFVIPNHDGALVKNPLFLFFIVLSIGAIYAALAGLLNTSSIVVSKDTLDIRHKPLPWPGNKKINIEDVKQLYTKEKISRDSDKTATITYQVYIVTRNGEDIKLVSGLEKSEQATFIEREIEQFLGIKKEDVHGGSG